MTVGEKQELFARLLSCLITQAHNLGFKVRLKELYRPKEMAEIYAERGVGIKNSLHTLGLAIDLVLVRNGEIMKDSEAYRPLGEFWKSLNPLCAWGGDFGDGGHFSIRHGGVA